MKIKLLIAVALLSLPVWGQVQYDRINPAAVNEIYYATRFATIQATITKAGATGAVIIPATYAGIDSYTNPNGILILDYRGGVLKLGVGSSFNAPSATFGATGTVAAVSLYSNGSGSPSAANNVSYAADSNHAAISENTGALVYPLKNPVYAGVTAVLGTSAISSGACASDVTVAYSGALTTDSIDYAFNLPPPATYNSLTIKAWPTAGNVNFRVCNPSAGSITPAAATLNARIAR